MKLNKFSLSLTVFVAILLAIPLYLFNVSADQGPIYQIRILEIGDESNADSSYALPFALAQQDNITVDTVPMKEFVTQPDELSGKYDAIYIGKGKLSNDMTLLKADEIIKEYINKGLPVILHKDVLNQVANTTNPLNEQSVLYNSFYKYSTTADRKANVLFVDDAELGTLISQIKNSPSTILEMLQQRPRVALDTGNTLIDYSKDTSHSYKAGDKLVFPFQTHHIRNLDDNRIRASLYMSVDKILNPADNNLVAATNVTGPTNKISYTLPKAYSGLLYWRLEVSDQQTGLKDYITGTIRYKDEKPVIRIIQVVPTDDSHSNLTKVLEPNLLESDSYKLDITAVSIDDFNTIYSNQLNGNYDTLIFGFQNAQNKYDPLSPSSAAEVQQFITTGQSVLFNDGTLYAETVNTGKTSGDIVNAFRSTTTSLVNEGLLTQYPFDLSKDLTSRASSKEITTSSDINTGELNTNSPLWEKQLFINTIYRSFMNANHAPQITVNAPTNNSTKPSYLNNLLLSYTVNDSDLNNRVLSTSVKFKHKGTYLNLGYVNKSTSAGDTITQSFTNPLPEGGDLQLEITVKDEVGAQATEIVNLTIQKVTANLETNRTLSTNVVDGKIRRDEEVIITYSISPKNISVPSGNKNENPKDTFVVSDLKYVENFPRNLNVSGAGITTTGSPSSGMTVKKTFKDITYQLSNDKKTYIPNGGQSVTFKLMVTPTVKGVYNLVDSRLDFRDIHSISKESPLGVAGNYNAFMLGDITVVHSGFTMNGRMASAGDILLSSGFGIGMEIPKIDGNFDDVLIANGNLTITNGGDVKGNAVYGGIYKNEVFGTIQGTVRKENPIDFTTNKDQLTKLSASLSKETPNGITTINSNTTAVSLVGTDKDLNIFNIPEISWNAVTDLSIDVPQESTVIINVKGTNLSLRFATILNGKLTTSPPSNSMSTKILYNFYGNGAIDMKEDIKIDMKGMTIEGSVLAPMATLTLNGGNIVGNYIGKSFRSETAGFGFYDAPFTGTLPNPVPTPIPPGELRRVVFPDVGFEAIVKVGKLTLEDTTILVGEDLSLIPTIEPQDANNQNLAWSTDKPEYVTLSSNGRITGLKPTPVDSPIHITITSTDGSNIYATAKVTVISPGLAIVGPNESVVNDLIDLKATYTEDIGNITSVVWTIKDANSYATITPDINDKWNASFQAIKSGDYIVVVTVKSTKQPNGITAEHPIKVSLKGLSIVGDATMNLGSTIKLDAVLDPINADHEDFTWHIEGSGSAYAEIVGPVTGKSIELKGTKETIKITVTVTVGGLSASHDVKISSILTGLQFSNNETTIEMGTSRNLNDLLWPIPRSYPLLQIREQLVWSLDRPGSGNLEPGTSNFLTLNGNGNVTGLKKGYDVIRVSYQKNPTDTPITATIKVIVVGQVTSDDKY
ncbi:DUF5057 domain-containing protein [Paenibacillus glacialis]|uniref:BIG2 domain-containing protein n=1 Tax=Paenibacillus glacialis TaxID=494026 RepID=A0A168L6T4_9BACL|nr:DUF5057 domain-containing protein [Paenibacillus glacialis]OAB42959.1 hypothetical protein PGLA_10920 [Paenibacillus glacialis]